MNVYCSCANCSFKRQHLESIGNQKVLLCGGPYNILHDRIKLDENHILFDLYSQSLSYNRPYYDYIHINNLELFCSNKPMLANLIAYSINLYCDSNQLEQVFGDCVNVIIIDFANILEYLGNNASFAIRKYLKIKLSKGYKVIVVCNSNETYIENILIDLFLSNYGFREAIGTHLFIYRTSYYDTYYERSISIPGGSSNYIFWIISVLIYNIMRQYKKIPIILTNNKQYMNYYQSFFKDLYPSDENIALYNYNTYSHLQKSNISVILEEYVLDNTTFNSHYRFISSYIVNKYFDILTKYLSENYYDTICGNTLGYEIDYFCNNTVMFVNESNMYMTCMKYLTDYHFCGYAYNDGCMANLEYPRFTNLSNINTGEFVTMPNAIYFMILLKKLQWIIFGDMDGSLDNNSIFYYLEHPEREI